jgi:hypothetical protein
MPCGLLQGKIKDMIYKKENISGIDNLTDGRLASYSLTTLLIL